MIEKDKPLKKKKVLKYEPPAKPDHRQVLPADEYARRIKKLTTSDLVGRFRAKYRRGE